MGENTSFVLNGVAGDKGRRLFFPFTKRRERNHTSLFDFRLIVFYIVLWANKAFKIFARNGTSIIGGIRWFDHTSVHHFGFVLMALMIKYWRLYLVWIGLLQWLITWSIIFKNENRLLLENFACQNWKSIVNFQTVVKSFPYAFKASNCLLRKKKLCSTVCLRKSFNQFENF